MCHLSSLMPLPLGQQKVSILLKKYSAEKVEQQISENGHYAKNLIISTQQTLLLPIWRILKQNEQIVQYRNMSNSINR